MGELFDVLAKTYDSWYSTEKGTLVHHLERQVVYELLEPKAGEKILDIGCGTGIYSIELAQAGLHVTGFDISKDMLFFAKQKAEDLNLDINFQERDFLEFQLQPGSFDKVISVTALEFFPKPSEVLAKAFHALKPGGKMTIGVIAGQSQWSAYYNKRAKEDPNSVFRRATFYTEQELLNLYPYGERTYKGCLYFSPDLNDFSQEKALALENAPEVKANIAPGFVCGLWVKTMQ